MKSNKKPGTNVSGTSDLTPVAKQMNLLKELIPNAKKVAMLYCSAEANSKFQVGLAKKEAKKLGLSKEEIQKKLDQKWVTDDSFVPLIKLKEYSKDLLDVKGIIVSTETGRIYPLGEAAAHLIGYMQNGEGKAGLEK